MIIGLSGLLEANWELSCLIIGVALYTASVSMRRAQSGQFLRFLFGTFILVGIGCSAFGVGALASSQTVGGLTLLLLSVITAWLIDDDKILTALMAVASLRMVKPSIPTSSASATAPLKTRSLVRVGRVEFVLSFAGGGISHFRCSLLDIVLCTGDA